MMDVNKVEGHVHGQQSIYRMSIITIVSDFKDGMHLWVMVNSVMSQLEITKRYRLKISPLDNFFKKIRRVPTILRKRV